MKVNPKIFKAYDIRGIFPSELDEGIANRIGKSFVSLLKPSQVIVGRDMRLSGEVLAQALIDGILEQGADVVDIGMVSTDQYYYSCATENLPGLMVTASHNPKEYNGFKMVRKMPFLLSGDSGIQEIQRLVEQDQFEDPKGRGSRSTKMNQEGFVKKVLSLIDIDSIRPMKVVVDTANGMVGPILQEVYRRLPVELIGLYLEPDGSLPNHGLDPLHPDNRAELQRRVVEEKADIGFAFDGDGDRFFAIDNQGEFVSGDFLTAIISSYFLERNPGSKIIYDVRASWAVPASIQKSGGTPIIERVGHAFIKQRMAVEGALFAGEVTGHYYFRDFFYADSGILPSLILLELLSRKQTSLSKLISPLKQEYFISGEINSKVDNPQERMELLAAVFQDGVHSWMDGISVGYPDWHFNVRASNTEPLLRLNLESILSVEDMERRRDYVLDIIRNGR